MSWGLIVESNGEPQKALTTVQKSMIQWKKRNTNEKRDKK